MREIIKQKGSAMLVTLLCLTVLTIVGLLAVRASSARLRTSMNGSNRISAVQNAQTMLNAVLSEKRDYLSQFAPLKSTQYFCVQTEFLIKIRDSQNRSCGFNKIDIPEWHNKGTIYSSRLNRGDGYLPSNLGLSQNHFTSIHYGIHVLYAPKTNINTGYAQIEQGISRLQIQSESYTVFQGNADLHLGR